MIGEKMELAGKFAVVTGGTSGIGAAIGRRFAAEGAVVALVGRNAERGAQLVSEIEAAGGSAHALTADVRDGESVQQLAREIAELSDHVDVLVNNAGIIDFGSVVDMEIDAWDNLMNTNVRGVFLCSKFILPMMMDTGDGRGGSVINISSNLGSVGSAGVPAYCASKGAVSQLTRSMALEHIQQGIRVNALCPGTTDTPLVRAQSVERTPEEQAQADERFRMRYPVGRIAEADEIADAALYLASDRSAFVVGAELLIDGGYTAQ
jgi:NAD(P)-dependent dehydrogenase (short-subunit alcohol dehydrogenase family)